MTADAAGRRGRRRTARNTRQQAIAELIASRRIASQHDLVALLAERGHRVTQATISRDLTELGVAKAVRDDRHVYVLPAALAGQPAGSDEMLRRVLRDLPVAVRRSGLILLLISGPGSAGVIAEAIDRSTLDEQEGTLAGDNTVLVLFRDEERLARWQSRLEQVRGGDRLPGEA